MDENLTADQIKERIEEALEGIAVMLVRMNEPIRRRERPILCIQRDGSSALGRWQLEPMPLMFDFKNFVTHNVMRFGEFYYDMAAKVSHQIVESVLNGDSIIPGFEIVEVYADTGKQGPLTVYGEKIYLRQKGSD